MEPASFLNLDLELRSSVDLGPFASYLESRASVLYAGEADGTFQLTAEPSLGGQPLTSLAMCTEAFLELFEGLPQNLVELVEKCDSRIFDYGFDGGLMSPPLSVDVPITQLTRMVKLGIGVRVTIYPHRTDSPINEVPDA